MMYSVPMPKNRPRQNAKNDTTILLVRMSTECTTAGATLSIPSVHNSPRSTVAMSSGPANIAMRSGYVKISHAPVTAAAMNNSVTASRCTRMAYNAAGIRSRTSACSTCQGRRAGR
jgi:hypothetical protein